MSKFLRVDRGKIVQGKKEVRLRGVNVGGWLLMEGYILHAVNQPEKTFKHLFARTLGKRALRDFEESFRDHFIQESDFQNIAAMGMNCVRVPFHYALIETAPYHYDPVGLKYLDRVVRWAKKFHLYVILDLHASCGSQNHDWHSDSSGQALLWKKKGCQDRTVALWEFIASRYAEEPAIAGYDLLNEAVLDDVALLNKFYARLCAAIRMVDKNHILFVEGNKWATDISCLADFADVNYALSVHCYEPLDFTFNCVPELRYPLGRNGRGFTKQTLRHIMARHVAVARKRKVPLFLGEFGVNARQGLYGEDQWLADILSVCEENHIHWTYWTYKAVKGGVFPDGLFSYKENPPWVNRLGPVSGWMTYAQYWPKRKKEMCASWQTPSFELNQPIAQVLKRMAKQK